MIVKVYRVDSSGMMYIEAGRFRTDNILQAYGSPDALELLEMDIGKKMVSIIVKDILELYTKRAEVDVVEADYINASDTGDASTCNGFYGRVLRIHITTKPDSTVCQSSNSYEYEVAFEKERHSFKLVVSTYDGNPRGRGTTRVGAKDIRSDDGSSFDELMKAFAELLAWYKSREGLDKVGVVSDIRLIGDGYLSNCIEYKVGISLGAGTEESYLLQIKDTPDCINQLTSYIKGGELDANLCGILSHEYESCISEIVMRRNNPFIF